jgi:hypothetical protein
MKLPVTDLEQRIAKAVAEQEGVTQELAAELVRDCLVNGPDSIHWDTVRPAAIDILKPYLEAMLPIVRMVAQALAPLLAAPSTATTTAEHIGQGAAYIRDRYGAPEGAESHETGEPGWYERGGRLLADDDRQGGTAAATP